MSTVLAYALSVLLNLGVLTPSQVTRNTENYSVVERDGKTILVDSTTGTEIVVWG